MIKTIRLGDVVGFRTFTKAIRYGEVIELRIRGEGGRPSRKDEVSVKLKPDGHVVMVQRWRIAERYDKAALDAGRAARRGGMKKSGDRQ